MSVRRNFIYSSAYQLLIAVAPLVTTPYLSRTIGANGNGIFTYTQSITHYFVLAATLGMSSYGVRTIAECGEDRERRSHSFWEAYAMNVLVGAFVFVAYVAYSLVYGCEYLPLYGLWGMWVVSAVLDVTWLLWGCQEFRIPTIRNFCTKLASILVILAFVNTSDDVWVYVMATAGAFLANALLIWPYVSKYVDWTRPTWKGMRSHLVPNLVLFVPVVAISIYNLMDKVMLGFLTTMTETGMYDYAEKVSKMPMSVITALGAVILPKMTVVMAGGDTSEAKRLIGSTMWLMQVCAMALSFGIAAVAPEFCPVFFGSGFEGCVPMLRILCVIVPLICATNVLGIQWLLPTKQDGFYTASVIAGAVVNVVVNGLMIPTLGGTGACIATVVAEVSVLLFQAFFVRKDLPLESYVVGTLPFVCVGGIMLVVIRFVAGMLGAYAATLGGLMTEVALGAIVFTSLSYLWCWMSKSEQLKVVLPQVARW